MSKRPHTDDFDEAAPLTEAEIAEARANPPKLPQGAMDALVRKGGRPALDPSERKKPVSIRLSPDVLKMLRASGDGWQTRVDDILREAMGLAKVRAASERAARTAVSGKVEPGRHSGTSLFERMAALAKAGNGTSEARDESTGKYRQSSAMRDRSDGKKKA